MVPFSSSLIRSNGPSPHAGCRPLDLLRPDAPKVDISAPDRFFTVKGVTPLDLSLQFEVAVGQGLTNVEPRIDKCIRVAARYAVRRFLQRKPGPGTASPSPPSARCPQGDDAAGRYGPALRILVAANRHIVLRTLFGDAC
jgi:hypothetical protein